METNSTTTEGSADKFRRQIEQLNTGERLKLFVRMLLTRYGPKDGLFIVMLGGVVLCGAALAMTRDPAYLISGILCLILARLAI